jgi:hypothetical protein
VPGISLAFLTDRSLQGAALLARSLGLGVGYIVVTGLGYAIIAGHAPERAVLLGLLAVPPLVLLGKVLRPAGPVNASQRDPVPGRNALATVALTAMVALTGILWAKLAHEGLNGDGTEAYELARSLADHPVPRWDLERWDGPGRFGTPAVNPFLTNSYLVQAGMTVMGRGELAARLPLVPAVVIAVVLAGSLASRAGRSGWAYLVAVAALYVLWNAYYVGYEPPFPDLAEPAATDTMMVALWLAGFAEVVDRGGMDRSRVPGPRRVRPLLGARLDRARPRSPSASGPGDGGRSFSIAVPAPWPPASRWPTARRQATSPTGCARCAASTGTTSWTRPGAARPAASLPCCSS